MINFISVPQIERNEFSTEWNKFYQDNTQMSIWPWHDIVSLVHRHCKPSLQRGQGRLKVRHRTGGPAMLVIVLSGLLPSFVIGFIRYFVLWSLLDAWISIGTYTWRVQTLSF